MYVIDFRRYQILNNLLLSVLERDTQDYSLICKLCFINNDCTVHFIFFNKVYFMETKVILVISNDSDKKPIMALVRSR